MRVEDVNVALQRLVHSRARLTCSRTNTLGDRVLQVKVDEVVVKELSRLEAFEVSDADRDRVLRVRLHGVLQQQLSPSL